MDISNISNQVYKICNCSIVIQYDGMRNKLGMKKKIRPTRIDEGVRKHDILKIKTTFKTISND